MARFRVQLRDVFFLLSAMEAMVLMWPAVRNRLKTLAQDDEVIGPFHDLLESIWTQLTD